MQRFRPFLLGFLLLLTLATVKVNHTVHAASDAPPRIASDLLLAQMTDTPPPMTPAPDRDDKEDEDSDEEEDEDKDDEDEDDKES